MFNSKIKSQSNSNIFNSNLLTNIETSSPDFFVKFLISIPPKFRNEKLTRTVSNIFRTYKSFFKSLYSKNEDLLNSFLLSLARILEPNHFRRMESIKRSGDLDDKIYIILSGKIIELSIKYEQFIMKKNEYISHLVKLYYLNEKELFHQTIFMNKSIFPLSDDINEWVNEIKEPDEQREFLKLYSLANKEIEESNYKRTKSIDDYIELIKFKPFFKKNKFNNLFGSTTDFNFSFKKNLKGDENVNFHLYIASYIKKNLYQKGDFIGYLAFTTKVKFTSSFYALERTECAVFQKMKNEFSHIMNKLKILKMNSIGPLYNSFYIFQDLTREYFEENIAQYFIYCQAKKGDYIIEQGDRYNGVYFVIEGKFKVTTNQIFQNLDYFMRNLKDCLTKNYMNYIKDSNAENLYFTIEKRNKKAESFLLGLNRESNSKLKEIREFTLGTINRRQLIGTDECYNHDNDLNCLSIQCISDTAEMLYLPKENFNSVKNKHKLIFQRLGKLIETQANKYILELQKVKDKYYLAKSVQMGCPKINNNNNNKDKPIDGIWDSYNNSLFNSCNCSVLNFNNSSCNSSMSYKMNVSSSVKKNKNKDKNFYKKFFGTLSFNNNFPKNNFKFMKTVDSDYFPLTKKNNHYKSQSNLMQMINISNQNTLDNGTFNNVKKPLKKLKLTHLIQKSNSCSNFLDSNINSIPLKNKIKNISFNYDIKK